MVQYAIIKCESCGNLIAIKEDSKTFRCPYCGVKASQTDSFGRKRFRVYAVVDGRDVPKTLAELKRKESKK